MCPTALQVMRCSLVIAALCTTWSLAQAPSSFICPDGRPIPIDHKCDGLNDCQDAEASDEQSCEAVEVECLSDQFRCADRSKCIPQTWVCDGDYDCSDRSDERRCAKQDCLPSQSRCDNGRCVPTSYFCDGEDDCRDNSDETNCTAVQRCAGEHQYPCANGLCIPSNWACDGEPDCEDSSDEMNCGNILYRCWYGMFNCSTGGCINVNLVCDGSVDCPGDDSDEQNCGSPTCESFEFQCPDKRVGCIPLAWKCDGEDDCGDWSDELDCDGRCVAEEPQYSCITGGCVDMSLRCDGHEDCRDGSDEFLCPPTVPLVCGDDEFSCWDGKQCIGGDFICDGRVHCDDGSDEDSSLCESAMPGVNECLDSNGNCSDICVDTTYAHFCSCHHGHYLDPTNRHICMDINECELPCTCSQTCTNLRGGYECSCVEGYELTASGRGVCKAIGEEGEKPFILLANRVDIRRVNLDGSRPQLCIRQRHNAIPLDFHYSLQYIFWADLTVDSIMRANMDCTGITTVIDTGLRGPGGLAVDWVANHLYWTDAETKRIEVSNLDGRNRKVLFGTELDRPRAIAVDPIERLLFWTDWGAGAKIERSDMDGTNRMVVQGRHLIWPNALTIDYPTRTLYWGDAKHHTFESSGYDGSNRRPVILEDAGHPFAISIFEDNIYWSDWETKSIRSSQKCNGMNISEVYSNLYQPMDLHVVHSARQPMPHGGNPCQGNQGGCEYLCLLSNSTEGYSCLCPTGITVADDGRSCERLNTFILFARRYDIQRISLDVDELVSVVLPLENLTGATALDWDSSTDQIYWTDVLHKAIYIASAVGTDQRVLIGDNLGSPIGLAIDWVTNLLYWTDATNDRIEVANLNGTNRGIIVHDNLDKPRAIVVHPTAGLMFWSDWGDVPKIERAALDGSQRVAIVTTNVTYPNGLALDYEQNRIYWVDAARSVMEYANFDGSGRRVLLRTNLPHPFGLSLYGDYVYWTDWISKSVQRANKFDGSDRSTIVANVENPMDIHVFHRDRQQPENNPCENNGGCSHLCLTRPNKRRPQQLVATCACPTGHTLMEDRHTCNPDIDAYLVFPTMSALHQVSLDTKYIADVVLNTINVASTTSVDVDIVEKDIYWTNALESKIYKTSMKGGPIIEVITRDIVTPEALAVDWIGRTLYWVDRGTHRLEVANLDGSNRRVLMSTDLVTPSSIALDLQSQTIFWTDMGNLRIDKPAKIEKAAMDGTGRTTVISHSIRFPRSITVDNPVGIGGRIYWTDSFHGTVDTATLDGGGRRNLMAGLTAPYGLAILGDSIYWSDFTEKMIFKARKSDGSNQQEIISEAEGLAAIKIIKTTDLDNKRTIDHPCDTDRGCSHLCLPSHSIQHFSCACPTGIQISSDGQTCPPVPSRYVLFSADTEIRRISMDTVNVVDISLITGLRQAVFIDFLMKTPTEGTLFWSDTILNGIFASNLDGTNIRKVVPGLKFPEGVAVDWMTGNLFWVDSAWGRKYLGVTTVEGEHRRLLHRRLDRPREIAVYPQHGLLYWTDWSATHPRIERSYMDGSGRIELVNTGLIWPNGLTIDYETNYLYWHDGRTHRMERVTLNGGKRRVVLDDSEFHIYHGFGLDVHSGFLYWSDWYEGAVFRAETDGTNQKKISMDLRDPKGLVFVNPDRPGELTPSRFRGPCTHLNGGCPYLCLPLNISHRRCACPDILGRAECNDTVGTPSVPTTPPTPVVTTEPPHPPTRNGTMTETTAPPTVDPPINVSDTPTGTTVTPVPSASPTTDGTTGTGSTGTGSFEGGDSATDSEELNKAVLIPLIFVIVILIIFVAAIIAGSVFYLKRQYDHDKRQHASVQTLRLQFSNPGFPATLNKLNSQNSVKPLKKQENTKRSSKVNNSSRNSSTINQHNEANLFVEEPEVFEIPEPPRRRRMPTPPDSPLTKDYDTFQTAPFRLGEKEPSPPPRPPKGVHLLRKMRRLPDMHSDEGEPTSQHSSSCSGSMDSSIDVKVDIEDGRGGLELPQQTSIARISLEQPAPTDESTV